MYHYLLIFACFITVLYNIFLICCVGMVNPSWCSVCSICSKHFGGDIKLLSANIKAGNTTNSNLYDVWIFKWLKYLEMGILIELTVADSEWSYCLLFGMCISPICVRFVLRVFGLCHTIEPDHCVIVLCMCVYENKL